MKFNFCRKNRRSSINQKKYIFMTLVLCALLSGCSDGKVYDETQKEIDPDRIISMMNPAPSYTRAYGDFAAMAEESSVIVYGEIMGVDHYMNGKGLCATKIDVEIMQPLKGEFNEGDMIQIVEDQGMVTIQDYLDSYTDDGMRDEMRKGYTEYSDDQLDDYYIVKLGQGDIMAEKGQKSIYLLQKSAFYDTENTYCRITGAAGSYTEVTEGGFTNTQTVGNILTAKDDMNVTLLSNDENSPFPTQTLDELIAEMNL